MFACWTESSTENGQNLLFLRILWQPFSENSRCLTTFVRKIIVIQHILLPYLYNRKFKSNWFRFSPHDSDKYKHTFGACDHEKPKTSMLLYPKQILNLQAKIQNKNWANQRSRQVPHVKIKTVGTFKIWLEYGSGEDIDFSHAQKVCYYSVKSHLWKSSENDVSFWTVWIGYLCSDQNIAFEPANPPRWRGICRKLYAVWTNLHLYPGWGRSSRFTLNGTSVRSFALKNSGQLRANTLTQQLFYKFWLEPRDKLDKTTGCPRVVLEIYLFTKPFSSPLVLNTTLQNVNLPLFYFLDFLYFFHQTKFLSYVSYFAVHNMN